MIDRCYHCAAVVAASGSPNQSVWATVRVTGYTDEFDVSLCQECARQLLTSVEKVRAT